MPTNVFLSTMSHDTIPKHQTVPNNFITYLSFWPMVTRSSMSRTLLTKFPLPASNIHTRIYKTYTRVTLTDQEYTLPSATNYNTALVNSTFITSYRVITGTALICSAVPIICCLLTSSVTWVYYDKMAGAGNTQFSLESRLILQLFEC